MALANMGLKRQKLVSILGRAQKRMGEEEEKKSKRKPSKPRYGTLDYCMKTTLSMDFVWITWNFKAWNG